MVVRKKPAAAASNGSGSGSAGSAGAARGVLKRPSVAARGAAKAVSKKPAGKASAGNDQAVRWSKFGKTAKALWGVYFEGCNFPMWTVDLLADGLLDKHARSVVIYYNAGDEVDTVRKLATQREPANVGLHRCYDQDMLEKLFGYRRGLYETGGQGGLMPNIAAYCLTPMRAPSGAQVDVHVINLIGYAFDSVEQPDYQYFFPLHSRPEMWAELVERMKRVWRFAFECARRRKLKRIMLPDVGGGAFSGGAYGLDRHESTSYANLKEASLAPVQAGYPEIEVRPLPRIPDWVFTEEASALLDETLLVNAWDPWSIVGNANRSDNSLDGFYGRCTAMGVLCWPKTNPLLRFESV